MGLALDPSIFLNISDFSLPPGQLTSRGFMQHIHLGKLIRSTYHDYFHRLTPKDMYIRSTNYLRTIRVSFFFRTAFILSSFSFSR